MMNVLKYNERTNLQEIIDVLKKGNLIVYPTDTIYGIAANINNAESIREVYKIKQRSVDKAISVCFHDFEQLDEYVALTKENRKIITKLLPGPYTFLVKKNDNISPLLTANSSIVGIRIPDNAVSHELTRDFPITSTSANITGKTTPDNINKIQEELGENIHTYIDAGKLKSKASTIIDLSTQKPIIVREGTFNEKILNDVLKIN